MATDNTLKQIEKIDKSLRWVKKYRPDHYEQRFIQLVEERRQLRKMAEAAEENPAVAAYGKSQVGKSYLMSNMLQQEVRLSDGTTTIKPFEVVAEGGKRYNFINEMNPITTSTEATGVVTRFSSFSRNPQRYCAKYPVLMRSLSVTDITLILCDGYFNDVSDYTSAGEMQITTRAEELYRLYSSREPLSFSPMTADDMLEMKSYFRKYINNAQAFRETDFFNKLALVIDRIPVDDYVGIFSFLWHEDPQLTALYKRLLGVLGKLSFRRDVYLPVEAVLHEGENENTIMSVQCLDGLGGEAGAQRCCDAYIRTGEDSFQKIPQIPKCELSAVCAEVVYRIGEEFLESTARYDMTDIQDPAVRAALTQGDVRLDMLRTTDLLDFPGARSRKKEQSVTLAQPKILTTVLLRGKVAYLFNKYSESKAINILLYCHDYEMNDVTSLYITLNEWVNQYVGATPEERARTLSLTGGISPLFYIATKFNVDMAESQNPSANERTAVDGRWSSRFKKVLYKECFNADSVGWVKNWTREGDYFRNSYLLRDYKYSGTKGSKLYSGFPETGKEQGLIVSRDYLRLLRESFCESDAAGLFFNDRRLAWDVAATMNNDGALYIIENLSRVAEVMDKARTAQFEDAARKIADRVHTIMKEYYVSDDTKELLDENIRKASFIFREMEFTCQNHPDYFGHLLQGLQLTEAESFKQLHRLLPRLSDVVLNSQTSDYELIRKRCGNFEGCTREEEKWERFISVYRFFDKAEAEDYLKARKIEARKLFQGEQLRRKNSVILSRELVEMWEKSITASQFAGKFSGGDYVDEIALSNLLTCIVSTADSLDLAGKIEVQIADYVDVLNASNINESLVADMVATTISDFVTDFGYRYLSAEQVATARRVSKDHRLPCFNWMEKERKEHYEEEQMTALFNEILDSESRYTPAYEANFNNWLEYMFVAFIANINVPDYDHEANDTLKIILSDLKQ